MLTDEPGQTSGKPKELFRPVLAQQEYCISPICVDRDGTLYYKNDSCYLMALEMELTLTVYQQKQILAGSAGKKHSSVRKKSIP